MSTVLRVSAEDLEVLLDVPIGHSWADLTHVADVSIDSGRWVSYHELVISDGERHWAAPYERGLTEMQENPPFESYVDAEGFVECTEVKAVEKVVTTIEWVEVE